MKCRVAFLLAVLAVVFVAAIVLAQKTQRFELQSLSPRFGELISSSAELERVATGFGFTEGPMWDPAGFLYVSDETINKIFRVYPNARKKSSSHWATRMVKPSIAAIG